MAYNDFKYTLNTLVPTALAALMLLLAACSSEQFDDGRNPGQQPGTSGPLITMTATQGDRPQTRLGYVDPNEPTQPIAVTWAAGDKFYVGKAWPAFSGGAILSETTAYFSPFTLTKGAGSKNAEFTGNTPIGTQNGDRLYAIYGDGKARIYPSQEDPGILFFDYIYPRQTANGDQSHLSATDFMLATATYETDQQPVFAFTHLGAMMKFMLTLPTAGLTVKQLMLTTTDGSKPFSDAAQWNKDGALALSNSSDSNSDQLLLYLGEEEGITLTGTNVLTAYMMVAPTTLTKDIAPIVGKDLKLEVTDADGVVYTATLKGADIEQGNYYIVEAELKKPVEEMSFTIEVSTTSMNYTIPFPTTGTLPADITVDWGDGSGVTKMAGGTELTRSNTFTHPYNDADRYTITITSSQMDAAQQQIPSLKFYQEKRLISMNTPMLNTGQTSFQNCFSNCINLTSLPPGLFDKNTQAMDFVNCFTSCTSLTSLPPGLFDKNTQATNFSNCFSNCTNLTSLPLDLFDKNTQATNFINCFYMCLRLVLNDRIFSSNTSLDRFKNLENMNFSNCFNQTGFSLTPDQQKESIAPRLWEYTFSVVPTSTGCYTFCKASNLKGTPTEWGTPK